ncbi:PREDICTED: LOW QUALITY PROTEIN: probable ATP-dependent RNA helicase DHX58 [Calidris pugnax]|uniref:LOW QUALITY PROTEIN: probable ATP-dependent RNA helicase DHX58 n=1 Tax=Calidris pugnax TaxID=198806 RepID=UPI00071E1948|nr:PREDICTED: LOW QUALITY PROTEIN: probable ATP-dependent RNA helicase DHX58 [Calidris pugnax]
MELRGYQREAVAPALRGRNSIVWLPTGAGKTRAAVHVCRQHLENRRGGRVAVLVNKVHLVDQHAKKEFHVLQKDFRVTAISGDTSQKSFFAIMVKESDVVICTAQILQNALASGDEDMRVELTVGVGPPVLLSLVIDECHHTHKEAVYNKIMLNYLQRKLSGQQDLPQILGLTASPGTGGATSFEGAVEHILQICANLDTEKITSAQEELQHLKNHVPQPRKQYDLCQERAQDPFGERLKKVMRCIHQYMETPSLSQDFGTQVYEQRIVELEKRAAETFCRKRRVCALHLRKYNDALLINDTVRMIDAFQCLQQFYAAERDMKDPTEQFLAAMFEENRMTLQALAGDRRYENPRLGKLEEILREHFQPLGASRGIVFTKTRQSAHSLLSWLQDTAALNGQHIRAAVLTGAGYSNQTRHMTQNEQQDVIKQFREGTLNLLFSTSVAEEGLDIPECNVVVRYGLMTNEIAMVQAQGRARAENSVYSVLAKANSREVSRELLNENLVELMERAIRAVQAMPEQEYRLKIRELQRVAVASWLLKEARISERRQLHDPDDVYLYCVNCHTAVCRGSDLRTVEGMHHVNVNPNFGLYYRVSSGKLQFQRTFKDWEPGCRIVCSGCSQDWGMEMIYRQVKLPILCIKNFVVETPAEKRRYKKWSAVTFPIKEFDYLEYCSSIHNQSF